MTEILQFFSKSKDEDDLLLGLPSWRKRLSNFALVPGGITVDGLRFPSVEHAFQASKFKFTEHPAVMEEFTCDGSIKTGLEAKKAGGRANVAPSFGPQIGIATKP